MNERKSILKECLQRSNIVSERIQNGPVTPRMVSGCAENLETVSKVPEEIFTGHTS